MSLIQFTNLYKSFGREPLFEGISFSVNAGEIVALIGENGCGKTTLLRLLSGQLECDSGTLTRAPHLTMGFLPQEVPVHAGTVRAFIEEGPLTELEKQMADCLEEGRLEEWAERHEEYERRGGYSRLPLEKIAQGLKLELDLPMAALSSGQRIRAALAKALMENPDLLLLDEPTNHLDSEMQLWLQEVLLSRKGAAVIVSHDRRFLNAACGRLIEIKRGILTSYGGNYEFYLSEQERLLERQLKAHQEQKEEQARLKQKIKALTFSKGKPPPPSDRNIMAYDRWGEHHQKSVQRNLNDLKARLQEIEKNPIPHPRPKSIKGLVFPPLPLTTPVSIELLQLSKGDRVVVTGPNGSGKTTLLKRVAAMRMSPSVRVAYLDQEVDQLPPEESPFGYFERRFNLTKEGLLRELHMAGLEGDRLDRPFATLSVGQRKRLMLLTLILEKPNLLLLDEPTNHLDLLTVEAFEKALLNFEGAILAVSHDTTFIEKIATTVFVSKHLGETMTPSS